MTQEIKERLEQAAETAWEQVQNEKLEYLESDNAGLREIVEELESQLTKYRKALEDVIIRLEEDKRFHALSIAKEVLKREEQ